MLEGAGVRILAGEGRRLCLAVVRGRGAAWASFTEVDRSGDRAVEAL